MIRERHGRMIRAGVTVLSLGIPGLTVGCTVEHGHGSAVAASGPAHEREVIATPGAPSAIGPYSQAIRVGDTLYLSGQIAIDPATGKMVEGGIEVETRQSLENARAVLEAAGFEMSDVVQAKVFLADLEEYGAMNAVYTEFFPDTPPARAALQVARIPLDGRVEIMLTAVRSR